MQSGDASEPQHKGLIAWFAANHVAANLLMLFLVIGGVLAVSNMKRETFPSVDPKTVTVTVPYPGATPFEVEEGVTSRVEEALRGIDGVKRVTSTAYEGSGVVIAELEEFADGNRVRQDVETEVDRLADFPPQDAEQSIIVKVKPTPDVVSMVLYGDVNIKQLHATARKLEDELSQLKAVSQIALIGAKEEVISIEITEEKLRQYGLTLVDIAQKVQAFSVNIPAGTIESRSGDVLLRVQEKGYSAKDFKQFVIRQTPQGALVRLGDIATIKNGFEDVNFESFYNGKPAIFINVNRSEAQDTLEVENAVNDYLKDLKLPNNLALSIYKSETKSLKDRINLLLRNGITGYMLVFLVLLLFLDLRLAFWASLGIPISFMGGLMIMAAMGLSINMITLFALIIVLGIVVDDAIVTGESIFYRQEQGEKGITAVINGVKDVIAPVTIGVLTSVAAFAPLALSTGSLGQILRSIPIAVISILAVSLIEAYFILPAHLATQKKHRWSTGYVQLISSKFSSGLERFTRKILMPFVRLCLKFRYVCLAVFLALLILTKGLVDGGIIKFVFFPQIEGDEVSASITMPVGTPYIETKKAVQQLEATALEVANNLDKELYEGVSTTIGFTQMGTGPSTTTTRIQSNTGQVRLKLVDSSIRPLSAQKVAAQWQKKAANIIGTEELVFESSLVSAGADITFELSHQDPEELQQAVNAFKRILQQFNGVTEITTNPKPGKQEYVFKLNDVGLAAGLTPSDLGAHLRFAFYGFEVQRLQRQGEEVKVMVRYPKETRESLETLQNSRIRLPSGALIPLSTVSDIQKQIGYSSISRANGQRIIKVEADTIKSIITPDVAIKKITETYIPELQKQFPGLKYQLEGESRNRKEDMASLVNNMKIGILVIFLMLGSLLKSYIQPLIILAVVPFGIVGAIAGHLLLGYNLTFISMFGIVALTGVIVNDSVVMIDYYNRRRKEGEGIHDAMLQAIERRFRPILLTTMTTVFGLLPILLETSLQARFLIPMVISLAFGLLFGTLIIMVLVPVLTTIIDDVRRCFRQIIKKIPLNQ